MRIPARLAILAAAASLTTAHAGSALAEGPVVVELFQSQGCSSCPPANANLNAVAGREDVLALSYGVTYWDSLGWKDTFAKPQFTERQWAYARSLHHRNVGTPQVVINGRRDIVGADRREFDAALRVASPTAGPHIALSEKAAVVGSGAAPADPARVWLVRYDPRVREVPIRRGENGGKTLPHRNIVVELTSLGRWTGKAATFDLPPAREPGLRSAILVQAGEAGPIIAAAKS